MAGDRSTTMDGDQITDGTIRSDELDISNNVSRKKFQQLMIEDIVTGQFKWMFPFGNKLLR